MRTQDTDGIITKTQYKFFCYVLVLVQMGEKNPDIVASSMFYKCDVDRTLNKILNIPCCHWFPSPAFLSTDVVLRGVMTSSRPLYALGLYIRAVSK